MRKLLVSELGLSTRTVNALKLKNISTVYELVNYKPFKYHDYRNPLQLKEADGKDCVIKGFLDSVSIRDIGLKKMVQAKILAENEVLRVSWFGAATIWNTVKNLAKTDICVAGQVLYDARFGYCMTNPERITRAESFEFGIDPVYKKIKGVSDKTLKHAIQDAITILEEPYPEELLKKYRLMGKHDALMQIHEPISFQKQTQANHRLIFDDMLYFVWMLNYRKKGISICKALENCEKFEQMKNELPFSLTEDQNRTIEQIKEKMTRGDRVHALIQGDVGCGKTIVALFLILLMAENGYQSVLIAPTGILAKQHYEEILNTFASFGYEIVLLTNKVRKKELNQVLSKIESGAAKVIIGTHSILSDSVKFHNLGMIVVDEEHRFGVEQREKIAAGIHTIAMSATPIPRTLAAIKYGNDKQIFNIKTMPKGRKVVQTAINNSEKNILEFVEKQVVSGRQCYVVCPLIEKSEVEKDNEKEKPVSLEEVSSIYQSYFDKKGIRIACLHGKMTSDEIDEVIKQFITGSNQILLATTVVEVGVNVPNANVMVIRNAERFGLATLHQLRGRVGRGSHQSYCILQSKEKENQRLKVMVETTDGFKIAEQDLLFRKTGNLIGSEQSGENHLVNLMLQMPNLYHAIDKEVIPWMVQNDCENCLEALTLPRS